MSQPDNIDRSKDGGVRQITWLDIVLVVAVASLICQLWPTFYSTSAELVACSVCFTCNLCDIRQWTWRSYAVANSLALAGLAFIRFRFD